MELETWRILPSMDSVSAAVAGLWLGSSSLKISHRDWPIQSISSKRNLRCRARSTPSSHGGSKDLEQFPSSIQVLRRKMKQKREIYRLEVDSSSIKKAFSSMVYMLRSMHRFTMEMLCCDEDLWSLVQREMHASFLWLFQQVFASTPKLMVSIMVLLANFTVHSMDCSFAAQSHFLAPAATVIDRWVSPPAQAIQDPSPAAVTVDLPNDTLIETEMIQSCGSKGGGGKFRALVAAGTDDDDSASWLQSWTTIVRDESGNGRNHQLAVMDFLQQVPVPKEIAGDLLVAPVRAKLEPDDYACFDRTDLLYQHALRSDGKNKNPLILANYAQFLYVVRHDHDRAEKLFRLAMEADPSDGESLGRFASFLWLARGDKQGAEDAYKGAIASDPDNPFHFGSYAHFLWHTETEYSSLKEEKL